jgi:hypothetical protein
MKAKEYAESFLASSRTTDDEVNAALKQVVINMMQEAVDICKMRHSESTSCLLAALREQADKWKAFGRIVNKQVHGEVIKPNGFKDFIENLFPEIKGRRY